MTGIPQSRSSKGLAIEDLAARVQDTLAEAASAGAHDPRSLALDREIVDGLHESLGTDAVLERLDLAILIALVERCTARCGAEGATSEARSHTWETLDLVRRPSVVRRIEADARPEWERCLLAAVEASQLTVGPLFRQRAAAYGSKVLFELPDELGGGSLTWRDVQDRVDSYARGLLALDEPDGVAPVAILSENRPEMGMLDLACLTSGLVDVMVPATATDSDVGFILRHAHVRTAIVSTREQLRKIQLHRESLPDLRRIITIESLDERGTDTIPLDRLPERGARVPREAPRMRGDAVEVDDLATIMYTSGTTGTPKGIQFSHRNLVFKRFARGLALPEIGDTDVFLAYLPLFHTFGRYLEMLGSVFWGAKYCFLLDPSVEALVEAMSRYRPTVFISVPRKWMQLYETIALRADPLESNEEELQAATRAVTGGSLRWGLSAAGYLDVEIFRFFHKHGIQVGSGFGMSEATGGITMTPPFGYRDGSLGVALPGIEIKLADDGELLMRGPYVMMGYLDPPDDEPSFDDEGWFHSGDLMTMDRDGHVKLVDRKKEIYKNVKGQTIAPQRIENLFREFESVGRVFLIGDHKPYNTLLIYPNPAYEELDFASLSSHDVKDHFRSLVVSVNRFVAPFERVVDYAIIDRDLDGDKGELTPKGTPRRKTVVENFDDVIAALYRRADVEVGGASITLPNWLFQTLGITTQDVMVDEQGLALPSLGTSLAVRRVDERSVQLGSGLYSTGLTTLDLGVFLATPRLWLGNEELGDFADLDPVRRNRPGRARDAIEWLGRTEPFRTTDADRDALHESMRHSEWKLGDLDVAARLLGTDDANCVLDAVRLLEKVVTNEEGPLAEPARFLLDRCATSEYGDVRRRGFQMLVPTERPARFPETLHRFFEADPALLDSETSEFLCERSLPEAKIEAFITFAEQVCTAEEVTPESAVLAQSLLGFLAEYGAAHPARFRTTREFLVRMSLFAGSVDIRGHAADARVTLEFGFRQFLGATAKIAVDPETGQEYRWEDVVVLEEGTPDEDRRRLLSAIRSTPFLREAVFLFYRGTMVRLHDIPPGGVWIRLIDTRHGKAVYRITVQTRAQNTYDFSANLTQSLTADDVQEEIDWLILCGDSGHGMPVVENFGGYLPDQDIWTEEFVSGDTLDREIRRLARRSDQEENLEQLWPFFAWSALSAYVDFWKRTGRRLEIAELSMADIVLPTHDYHTGSRIVSLSARRAHRGLLAMLRSFCGEFVEKVVEEHPELEGIVGWDVVFSSVLEVVGEKEGLAMYERALEEESGAPEPLRAALAEYVVNVGWRGFLPMRLYFAAKRYRRWARLSEDATATARARTLQEFYDTYGLDRLAATYPEVRLRFFRETVFRETSAELAAGLDELITRVRSGELVNGELAGAIADLRQRLRVAPDDDYFLARIPFAHLQPEDAVHFVTTDLGGSAQSEIVVNLEDADGNGFRVRHVLLPKEVERLHRLFLSAKLDVRFRPEHRYLVAINDRDQIVGGIFYETEEGGQSAHLEKIVVAEGYRRKGVADGLMKEFFNRLRSAGARRVTTGFFRPEYFYSYGFKIERKYAGLVKELDD